MKNLILLFPFLFMSCNSKTVEQIGPNGEVITYEEPKITGDKYFNYDQIVHYKNQINEDEVTDKNKTSKLDSIKRGIVLGGIPKSITDKDFLSQLDSIGYKKTNVDPKKFQKIDEIFTEKKHQYVESSACVYVYRDILVFKKKSKVVGIAKICFGCGDAVILGTKSNTLEFGQSGDYWKLEKLLYNK